ncbi:hypothetical protein [Brevundimonas sp.]|uniref:hypothetical protein n=2 Tax=Brevundimonas sp. TaxID=1871086 RepID=UPI003B00E0CE
MSVRMTYCSSSVGTFSVHGQPGSFDRGSPVTMNLSIDTQPSQPGARGLGLMQHVMRLGIVADLATNESIKRRLGRLHETGEGGAIARSSAGGQDRLALPANPNPDRA